MKITANAKINLILDVESERPDGYHNVKMIMQTLEFGDTVTVNKSESGIRLNGSGSKLAYDSTNLAYKSAELFFEKTGIHGGADIYIEKKIPICAGLAGGSSDAAAVLILLNELYQKPFEDKELLRLGALLGADVPFCIAKGTMLSEGIGDILTPLKPFPKKTVLIVKPEIDVPTPWAYKSLKLDEITHPDTKSAVKCIENGNTYKLYGIMENIFEKPVFEKYPIVGSIKQKMKDFGADAALMSGSGPTVFGIFENPKLAGYAYNEFKNKYNETILTKSFNV